MDKNMADTGELLDAINLARNHYFKKTMNNKGRFIYEFHPSKNTQGPRYNMLRHAGTIYSMLEVNNWGQTTFFYWPCTNAPGEKFFVNL